MKFEDRIQLKLSDLTEILQRYHHIPEDVVLVSDSGWEGGQTSMDGIYYNQAEKTICFTHGYGEEMYHEPEWSLLWTGRTQGNINTSIFCTDTISLFPFNASACMYEQMIKKELKEQGEFEFYYGVKETEGCYDLINLVQPLFWGIQVRDNEHNISNFVGYIGLNEHDLEVYILKKYRGRGYAKTALRTLVDFAWSGRLKLFDDETEDIVTFVPEMIKATVRKDNIPSRALMESCGFALDKKGPFILLQLGVDNMECEAMECVKYIYV